MTRDDDSSRDEPSKDDEQRDSNVSFDFEVGGLLDGIEDIVSKLGDVAEEASELERAERVEKGDDVEGVWGFRVRTDIGEGEEERDIDIDSFGNMRSDDDAEEVVVEERREPMVDVYNEEEYVLITAEMPGIGEDDVRIRLDGDVMTISSEEDDKRYYKELVLEETFDPDDIEVSSRNGIIRIKCRK